MKPKPYSEALEEAIEKLIGHCRIDRDQARDVKKAMRGMYDYTLTQEPVVQGLRDAIHNYLSTPSHDRETSYILKDCMQIALEDYDASIRGLE